MSEYVDVAKIGKTVGVKGDLRLQILSDFPEIIIPGRAFYKQIKERDKSMLPERSYIT